jgi:hypothetical protein
MVERTRKAYSFLYPCNPCQWIALRSNPCNPCYSCLSEQADGCSVGRKAGVQSGGPRVYHHRDPFQIFAPDFCNDCAADPTGSPEGCALIHINAVAERSREGKWRSPDPRMACMAGHVVKNRLLVRCSDFYPTAQLYWNAGVHNFMLHLTGDNPVGGGAYRRQRSSGSPRMSPWPGLTSLPRRRGKITSPPPPIRDRAPTHHRRPDAPRARRVRR